MRRPTPEERKVVLAIANKLSTQARQQILSDISESLVSIETEDGSRRRFHLQDYRRLKYSGQHPYPAEGRMEDVDGAEITVRLYADEAGRLLELELIKWSESPLLAPRWATFVAL